MNEEPDQTDRRTAIQRYQTLVAAVTSAINAADPIGLLEIGAPRDEYEPEVGTIVPRVSKAADLNETHQIVHAEFERWFGLDTAGPPAAYEALAHAIWAAVLEFRRAG